MFAGRALEVKLPMPEFRNVQNLLSRLASEEYCYLTTTGRFSGRPHEIEIWFGAQNSTLYLLSGSTSSDWVKNLRKNPAVTVQIGGNVFHGTARQVQDPEEDSTARFLVAAKYQEWEEGEGRTLSAWARSALPIAIDLTAQQ
jgi:deazaflavin-dependent oxidoreductase (nitroreductase family)